MLIYRVVVGCLLVCLQLQACVATAAAVLGGRHTHRASAKPPVALDSMEGWQDFRRVSPDDSTRASRAVHAAMHTSLHSHGVRHHHDAADTSVVKDEATRLEESAATELAPSDVAGVYIKAALIPQIAPAVELSRRKWRTAAPSLVGSPPPWRIERPPQTVDALLRLKT